MQLLNRSAGTYETVAETGFEPGQNIGEPLRAEQVERLLVERARRGVPAARRRRSLRARARACARLPVAAERPRPARLEQPLALRAPLRPSRPRRLHLGGRPAGPAAPRAGALAHSARVREPGDDGARTGSPVRVDPGGARAPARADRGVAGCDRRLRLRRARALVERRRDGDVRLDARRGDRPRQPHRPRRRAGHLPRAPRAHQDDRRGAARSRLPSQPPRRSADRRQRLGRPDPRRTGPARRRDRVDGRRDGAQAVRACARDERRAQGRNPARGTRLCRDRRPRRTRHRGEPGDRGDVRLDAQRSDRPAVPRADDRRRAPRGAGSRARDRLRPAARRPARGERDPRRPAPLPRRARDHARRRPRPAPLRGLAPRRHEAPPARRAHARGRGEVPHARRAAADCDVRQRRGHAGADALHEPADRDDARLPGLRLAPL